MRRTMSAGRIRRITLVFNEALAAKTRIFLGRWQTNGWQSWTLAEQRTYDELVGLAAPNKP